MECIKRSRKMNEPYTIELEKIGKYGGWDKLELHAQQGYLCNVCASKLYVEILTLLKSFCNKNP